MTLSRLQLKILWFAALSALLTVPDPAWAHKVILFAWVENGVINVESRFASQRPAVDCPLVATDDAGRIVHEGRTDDQGLYAFNVPAGLDSDLVLTLRAGPGHQGEWRIPKDELVPAASDGKAETAPTAEHPAERTGSDAEATPLKILSGIAVIFGLAWAGKRLIRGKKGRP